MKTLFTTILFVIITTASFCQLQLGIKTGYNWFKIFEKYDDDHPSTITYDRNSFFASIFFRQRTPRIFNLGFEIEYMQRNYSVMAGWGSEGDPGNANYTINSDYITFQFQPQFTFGTKLKFFVYPGIYFGTLINSSFTGTLHQSKKTEILNSSAKGYIPDIEFGTLAGFGLDIPIYKYLNLTVENSYSCSLLPKINANWGNSTFRFFHIRFEVGISYVIMNKNKSKK
ncbi:MAG: outer membrane beta-barrel protein [Bacteroidales bacterium]|jgi:hypothetical protein